MKKRPVLSSWNSVLDYCRAAQAFADKEQFRILFLDKRNQLIADEVQQQGTVDHTPVYPREVVKRALELSATAIILVHNHPSGDPTPSQADIDMTKQVASVAKPLGVSLRPHHRRQGRARELEGVEADLMAAWAMSVSTSGHPMKRQFSDPSTVSGQCLCGAVSFEIDYPAFWAWHDHGRASRLAHGAAYATYVGCWRKRFRVTAGERDIARYEDKANGGARSFCKRCGTPLIYERARSRHMINIPRALFASRTGRQPIYHLGIEELQEWIYTGAPLLPLKGYPGVVWSGRSAEAARRARGRLDVRGVRAAVGIRRSRCGAAASLLDWSALSRRGKRPLTDRQAAMDPRRAFRSGSRAAVRRLSGFVCADCLIAWSTRCNSDHRRKAAVAGRHIACARGTGSPPEGRGRCWNGLTRLVLMDVSRPAIDI